MGQLDVIDVTVVGGPDVAAQVSTSDAAGGRRLDITLAANATIPAVVDRVGIVIEAPSIRRLVAHGWLGSDGARRLRPPWSGTNPVAVPQLPTAAVRPGDAVSHQLVVTDGATIGWMGVGRHPGVVVVQRDGWLVTAWALLGGLILGPGETAALDGLWLGSGEAGPSMVGYATAWAADAAVTAPRPGLPGAVWLAPGPPSSALNAAPVLAGLGVRVAVLDTRRIPGEARASGGTDGLPAIAERTHSAGLEAGILVEPGFGAEPADLTRPGTVERLTSLGAGLRAAGLDYVIVGRCAPTLSSVARWGDASTTPQGALRLALEALRASLGPGPVVHLAGAPVGVAPGVADVVECTSGDEAGTTLGSTAADAALRSPLHGRVWAAATGPLDPSRWGRVDSAAVDLLRATTSTVVLTGDPRHWDPSTATAVRRLASTRSPTVDGLEPWGAEVVVSGDGRRRAVSGP